MTSFGDLCEKTFKDQIIWFANGFWGDAITPQNAETFMWDLLAQFTELAKLQGAGEDPSGELDALFSARFLEVFKADSAMTAIDRKNALRTIDVNHNGKMAPIEYLAWKFNKTPDQVINSPQGGGTPEDARRLQEAQQEMRNLQTLLKELQEAQAAQKKEEEEYARKKKELEQKSQTGGVVSRNRAKNELEQLLAEDPLPLRRAKITTDAAVRRVVKQLAAVEKLVEELVKKGGVAAGNLWMMQREMFDVDSRLPTSKMKFNHREPFFYDPTH